MFSEIRSHGPRSLLAGTVHLPRAIEHIGALVVPGWIGIGGEYPHGLSAEREAAARADEAGTVANYFEPTPEPAAPGAAVCEVCGKPATRIRAGQPYCARHGNRLPIPKEIRRLMPKAKTARAEDADAGKSAEPDAEPDQDDQETRPLPDQAALIRWAKASAALRDKVLAGELPAALREPSGKIVYPTAAQWRTEGFPAPDEACARWASCGHVKMDVIFETAEVDQAFSTLPTEENQAGRPSMMPNVARELRRRAEDRKMCPAWRAESQKLASWAKVNTPAGQITPRPATIERDKDLRQLHRELVQSAASERGN